MKIFGKLLIILVIFSAGLMLGLTFKKSPAIAPTVKTEISGRPEADLIIDYGNGEVSDYDNIEIQPDETIFELLKAVAEREGLEFGYQDYGPGMGAFVESINNIKNDYNSGFYWQYWLNDEYASVGASSYILRNGDKVKWIYSDRQY